MTADSKELRALIAAATPGPWTLGLRGQGIHEDYVPIHTPGWGAMAEVVVALEDESTKTGEANAALIVAAVNNLEPLLSTNEALARENEKLREALKPFANAVGLGGYDDQVVVELSSGPLTRGQFRAARQALEPSHDQ